MAALLGNPGPAAPPDDPVLARLLPDAYRDDTEAAGEFRRFTEQELRSGKLAAAQTVLDTLPEEGGRVELTEEDAQVWLRALNDVRLALGVRLDITEDTAQRTQRSRPGRPPVGLSVGLRLAHLPAGDAGTRALVIRSETC